MLFKKIFLISNYTPDGGVNSMFKEAYDYFKTKNSKLIIYFFIKNDQKFNKKKYEFIKKHDIRLFKVNSNIEAYKFIRKLNIYDFNSKNDLIFTISGTILMNLILRNYFNSNIYCWVATSYLDEKKSIIINKNIFKKIFFKFFEMPICIEFEKYLTKKLKDKILSLSTYTFNNFNSIINQKKNILNCPVNIKIRLKKKITLKNEFNIFFTGRLNDPRKNLKLFLQVVNSFNLPKYHNIFFYLIGGELNYELKYYVKKNKLINVKIIKYLDKKSLYKLYPKMNLFLLTSLQEGLCISAIEATYFGIPIISTKCGGISDVLLNNYNGNFANYDFKDINNKIRSLVNDKKKYDTFRKNSKDVYNNFDFKTFSKNLECIINK
tara:strand:+ start:1807 stop:2940 length:1134 start_codon:yes stop_codon:yes gene_type:complete